MRTVPGRSTRSLAIFMRDEPDLRELQVECPNVAVGYVIGELSRIGSWVIGQREIGDRVVLTADVPEAAISGFAEWLNEFRPVQGSAIVTAAANDEDG